MAFCLAAGAIHAFRPKTKLVKDLHLFVTSPRSFGAEYRNCVSALALKWLPKRVYSGRSASPVMPISVLMVLVLPAPVGPSIPKNPSCSMLKERLFPPQLIVGFPNVLSSWFVHAKGVLPPMLYRWVRAKLQPVPRYCRSTRDFGAGAVGVIKRIPYTLSLSRYLATKARTFNFSIPGTRE